MCDHMQGLSLLFLSDQHHKIGIKKLFRLAFFSVRITYYEYWGGS